MARVTVRTLVVRFGSAETSTCSPDDNSRMSPFMKIDASLTVIVVATFVIDAISRNVFGRLAWPYWMYDTLPTARCARRDRRGVMFTNIGNAIPSSGTTVAPDWSQGNSVPWSSRGVTTGPKRLSLSAMDLPPPIRRIGDHADQ
jgi:hypothetical protein